MPRKKINAQVIHGKKPRNYTRRPALPPLPPDRAEEQAIGPQVVFGDAAIAKLSDRKLLEQVLRDIASLKAAMDL